MFHIEIIGLGAFGPVGSQTFADRAFYGPNGEISSTEADVLMNLPELYITPTNGWVPHPGTYRLDSGMPRVELIFAAQGECYPTSGSMEITDVQLAADAAGTPIVTSLELSFDGFGCWPYPGDHQEFRGCVRYQR